MADDRVADDSGSNYNDASGWREFSHGTGM